MNKDPSIADRLTLSLIYIAVAMVAFSSFFVWWQALAFATMFEMFITVLRNIERQQSKLSTTLLVCTDYMAKETKGSEVGKLIKQVYSTTINKGDTRES
jgi:hypothetical protein